MSRHVNTKPPRQHRQQPNKQLNVCPPAPPQGLAAPTSVKACNSSGSAHKCGARAPSQCKATQAAGLKPRAGPHHTHGSLSSSASSSVLSWWQRFVPTAPLFAAAAAAAAAAAVAVVVVVLAEPALTAVPAEEAERAGWGAAVATAVVVAVVALASGARFLRRSALSITAYSGTRSAGRTLPAKSATSSARKLRRYRVSSCVWCACGPVS